MSERVKALKDATDIVWYHWARTDYFDERASWRCLFHVWFYLDQNLRKEGVNGYIPADILA